MLALYTTFQAYFQLIQSEKVIYTIYAYIIRTSTVHINAIIVLIQLSRGSLELGLPYLN
jgi:hypothetical protein